MDTLLIPLEQIQRAADLLKRSELVAFPTETVYGLGAIYSDSKAVEKVFLAKGRPPSNPLIVHISKIEQIEDLVCTIPPSFWPLAEHFFPGPLTCIFQKSSRVSSLVSAGQESVAIRMPAHPLAKSLINLVGVPLVAPSANLSGKPSPTRAEHVMFDLSGKIAAVIDGGTTKEGIESTVLDLRFDPPKILRHGPINKKQIESVLGMAINEDCSSSASPGTKHRHYAPKGKVFVFDDKENIKKAITFCTEKKALFSDIKIGETLFFPLEAPSFYDSLRKCDELSIETIFILLNPAITADLAFFDRIKRSAGYIS